MRGKAKFDKVTKDADLYYNEYIKDGLDEHAYLEGLGQEIMNTVMRDDTKSEDHLVQKTDYNWLYEKLLSSIFLRNNYFNHCCVGTTVLLVDNDNKIHIVEDRYEYDNSFELKIKKYCHVLGM